QLRWLFATAIKKGLPDRQAVALDLKRQPVALCRRNAQNNFKVSIGIDLQRAAIDNTGTDRSTVVAFAGNKTQIIYIATGSGKAIGVITVNQCSLVNRVRIVATKFFGF